MKMRHAVAAVDLLFGQQNSVLWRNGHLTATTTTTTFKV